MRKLKILIIGNVTSSGNNLKLGLIKYHRNLVKRVDLVFDKTPTTSGRVNKCLLSPEDYDIVLYIYPFIKTFYKYFKYITNAKILVCWWRGTDIRLTHLSNPISSFFYRNIQKLLISYLFVRANYHLYSTNDLRWFLNGVPDQKKARGVQIIDTSVFKDYKIPGRKGTIILKKGAKGYSTNHIEHKDMPMHLNNYKFADITPNKGVDNHIISATVLECLSCGLTVKNHEDKNRKFVIKNYSIKVRSKEMLELFLKFKNHKID